MWDYKSEASPATLPKSKPQNDLKLLLKFKQRKSLLDSLKKLQSDGYLSQLDVAQVERAIEGSEVLFRELNAVHDTFGVERQGVYAGHIENVLRQ